MVDDATVIAAVESVLELAPDDRVVSVVIVAEFMTLDSTEMRPDVRRLVTTATDNVTPWQAMGMCQFMIAQQEAIAVREATDGD